MANPRVRNLPCKNYFFLQSTFGIHHRPT
uniref:Uncharacterized protein n=1 Tax=Rhizophora mucronata TaxID=61149 RepID=A0A2P2J1X4_RHIMU